MAMLLADVDKKQCLIDSAVANLPNTNVTVQGGRLVVSFGCCVRSGAWSARVQMSPTSSSALPSLSSACGVPKGWGVGSDSEAGDRGAGGGV
eukprot:1830468-Rhodomonas_salina.1